MISEQITENNISLQERIITFETSIQSNYQQEEAKIWKEKKIAKDKVHEIATNNFLANLSSNELQQTPPQKEGQRH